MISFNNFYFLEEGLDTKRRSMVKITQMNPKQFIEFIETLKTYVKGNKFDLSSIDVTEKIDGNALRIAVMDDTLYLESSYSGMKSSPSDFGGPFGKSFSETFKFLKKNMEKDLRQIAKKYSEFKLIGEYLYTDGAPIDPDGTVTFVATKYDASKLGTFGTFVAFDLQELNEDRSAFESGGKNSEQILKEIKKLSNAEFTFFTKNDIKWSGHLELTYEMDEDKLSEILSSKEFLSDKANKETFENIKHQIANAFTVAFATRGSVLGIPSSTVEGIVLNFENEGLLVGAQNPEWKVLKNKIFEISDRLSDAFSEFTFSWSGFKADNKIRSLLDDDANLEKFSDIYAKNLDGFKKTINDIKKDWMKIRSRIPANVEKLQGTVNDNTIEKYLNLTTDIRSFKTAIARG